MTARIDWDVDKGITETSTFVISKVCNSIFVHAMASWTKIDRLIIWCLIFKSETDHGWISERLVSPHVSGRFPLTYHTQYYVTWAPTPRFVYPFITSLNGTPPQPDRDIHTAELYAAKQMRLVPSTNAVREIHRHSHARTQYPELSTPWLWWLSINVGSLPRYAPKWPESESTTGWCHGYIWLESRNSSNPRNNRSFFDIDNHSVPFTSM